MKIYHTETQADYDALMIKLEEEGVVWVSWRKPTESKDWNDRKENTCVKILDKKATRGSISFFKEDYPNIPITKYTAEGEKMRFTKENVGKILDEWFAENTHLSAEGIIANIEELDDAPEKVVVPKFVGEFYDSIRDNILSEKFKAFETTTREDVSKWYMDFKGRHNNNRANAQETIAKMDLYNYTIEPEKLYYIPLPDLEMLDGSQQMLSKSKNGNHYFASRPDKKLKQRYTKAELEQVPEIYKPFAKPIEGGEE